MRYLPLSSQDRQDMFKAIGAQNVDSFYSSLPDSRSESGYIGGLALHKSEMEVETHLRKLGKKNKAACDLPFFLGGGAYRHHIPASVDHLIQRAEFLTSYTPYQPEIAQGTLQALFEFQTQVARLCAMDVANASMYDGSTAAAEAMLMACRITKRQKAILAPGLHPHYIAVIKTSAEAAGIELVQYAAAIDNDLSVLDALDTDTACIIGQTPNIFGQLTDFTIAAQAAHEKGALFISVFTEAVSLGLVKPPGEMDADIAVGEGQSIGNMLNFGGPYVGLFTCREKYVRQMPGRLAGQTVDKEGRRGFVLTLSTREQHIRRDKATSNICTNSGLCALAFTIHMSLLGEKGLTQLAELNHAKACKLADALDDMSGVEVLTRQFFNEFAIQTPQAGKDIVSALLEKNIMGGIPASRLFPEQKDMENIILVAVTELNSDEDIALYAEALEEVLA